MRRFGIWTIAAGVWVSGVAHAQDVDPQAHGAVAGGVAVFGPPPPPPTQAEPAGPDLPVAVGISAGTATFLPGGGEPAGGIGAPSSQGGAGGGGGRSGGGSGGGTVPRSDGLPLLPAPTPSLTDSDPGQPTTVEEQPSVGGPQELEPITGFFFPPPPPPPPVGPLPPPLGQDPEPTDPPPGTDTDPPSPPGPIVEGPEPGTLVLAGIGMAGALGWRRRRRT